MSTTQPFVMTPTAVIFDTALPALVRVCYSALEDFSGEHRTCWPGYAALAKKVGCSVRWIPHLLQWLVKAGLLLVQCRQGKSNIYTLLGRVARQPQKEQVAPPMHSDKRLPMHPDNYEQKQAPKTNNNRASRRFNQSQGQKNQPVQGPIDFTKFNPGGSCYRSDLITSFE
jgi:hypothetical protein